MKFDEILTVEQAELLPEYDGIKALIMKNNKGHQVYLEYPEKAVGVEIYKGLRVRLCLDNVKDPDYRKNWDVYMWGKVYYVSQDMVKISLGGLILEIRGFSGPVSLGEKVYVGLKIVDKSK